MFEDSLSLQSFRSFAMPRKGVLAGLSILVVLPILILCSIAKVWDGRFDLTVHVSSSEFVPQAVSCEPEFKRVMADFDVEHFDMAEVTWSTTADPFTGDALTVPIPVSGRELIFGFESSRTHCQWLAIIAVAPDGKRIGKVVEIPDGRKCREIYVKLP
jgi:hypothetical protein